MKLKTNPIIKKITRIVHQKDPHAEIILFGSRARGDERPDSDWDILILTTYPVDLQIERKFRNLLYDIELETGEVFSVFVYSKKDWLTRQSKTPFYWNIISEGIAL